MSATVLSNTLALPGKRRTSLVWWLGELNGLGYAHGNDLAERMGTPDAQGPGIADNVATAADIVTALESQGIVRKLDERPTREQQFFGVAHNPILRYLFAPVRSHPSFAQMLRADDAAKPEWSAKAFERIGAARTHVSYSQLTTHRRCRAKWWHEKIGGVREGSTPAQQLGTDVHAAIEAYLLHGTPFPDTKAGKIASAGIHFLPAPKSGNVLVEVPIDVELADVPFVGYIDVLERDTHATVTDHKTTSDPKYADTADKLPADWQLCTYARDVFDKGLTHNEHVRVRKIYYLTRGAPKAWPVEAWVSKAHVDKVCADIEDEIRALLHTATLDIADVPKNFDACTDYNKRCVNFEKCHNVTDSLDALWQIEETRNTAKGKPPMTAQAAPTFDRAAFVAGLSQPPVANASDPITQTLVTALQEHQIRALGSELGIGTAQSPTVEIVAGLKATFTADSSTLQPWINYIREKVPANTAPVNPPESSLAPPVEQIAASMAQKAATDGTKKQRSRANSENETALRAFLRTQNKRNFPTLITHDKAPASTDKYRECRDLIRAGQKTTDHGVNHNALINVCAAEFDARGMSVHVVRDWFTGAAPTHAPVDPGPLPAKVATAIQQTAPIVDAATARMAHEPTHNPASVGIASTEYNAIQSFLATVTDDAFAKYVNAFAVKTARYAEYRERIKTQATSRNEAIHEYILNLAAQGITKCQDWLSLYNTGAIAPSREANPLGNIGSVPPMPVHDAAHIDTNDALLLAHEQDAEAGYLAEAFDKIASLFRDIADTYRRGR